MSEMDVLICIVLGIFISPIIGVGLFLLMVLVYPFLQGR